MRPKGEPRNPGTSAGALEGVYRSAGPSLVGLARLLLDEPGEAEEVVQEAFVRTYEAWPRVRDQADPLAYVRQVVVNLARGGLRRRRSARRWRPDPPRDEVSAEETVVDAQQRDEVAAAVRALSRRQRECVVLRYYLECSLADIAEATRISVGAVKQHLHRGLENLASALGERAEEGLDDEG